jgi:methylglyoxal synthase
MKRKKTIGVISHDWRKNDMKELIDFNAEKLLQYELVCTGTTGTMIKEIFKSKFPNSEINIECKNSGPLGGDQQIGSMIVEGKIDLLIFLIDDLHSNPHQADISALERQARLHNVPTACNRATADMILTSNLLDDENYVAKKPQYKEFDRVSFEKQYKLGEFAETKEEIISQFEHAGTFIEPPKE